MIATRWADYRLGLPSRRQRRKTNGTYIGDGVVLARVLNRYKMFIPARDMSVAPSLILEGVWEPWVTRAIAERIRPGMIAADVGANIGYFTLFMADRVGAAGHVHAFEPNPALPPLIERSVTINGFTPRVTIHQTALGSEDGREMLLIVPGDYLGGASVWDVQPQPIPDSHRVAVRRLDAIPELQGLDLIKIDAEGAEQAIWAGMAGLIAGSALRTVFIEFTAGHYADPAGFLAELTAPGFRLSIVDERRGIRPTTPEAVLAMPPDIGPMLVLER